MFRAFRPGEFAPKITESEIAPTCRVLREGAMSEEKGPMIADAAGRFMTVKEAAAYLGVSVHSIYRWSAEGRLRCRKLGRASRFMQEDLDSFAAVGAVGAE